MTFQDKVSIAITVIFGFLVGGYVYLAGFAPTFGIPEVGTADIYNGLIVTADSYGSCEAENKCLAFQVLGNGEYRAIYDVTGERIVVEDAISKPLRTKMNLVFGQSKSLAAQAELLPAIDCEYGATGTNYRLTIEMATSTYKLDTCRTAIQYDGAVWEIFRELWNALSTPKS
jgi:hypothetical protein